MASEKACDMAGVSAVFVIALVGKLLRGLVIIRKVKGLVR
jgi:hypothetical protein